LSSKGTKSIHLGPNPAKDVIYFYNKDNTAKYLAQFFDRSGRLIYSTSIDKTQESVNISRLQKGAYILKLSSPAEKNSSSYQFIKW